LQPTFGLSRRRFPIGSAGIAAAASLPAATMAGVNLAASGFCVKIWGATGWPVGVCFTRKAFMNPVRVGRLVVVAVALAGGAGLALSAAWAVPTDAQKAQMKEIMLVGHKNDDAIVKKVAAGKATAEEKAKLLEYYKTLAMLEPSRGSKESWTEKTGAAVKAAQALVDGAPNAAALVKAASDCKGCHSVHKTTAPPKK
jgi:hypothetical protein